MRYTFYNIDGTYLRDTGSYRNIPSYSVNEDCYASITYEGTLTDENINKFTTTPLVNNNVNLNFNFYAGYSTKFESNVIFLNKGDIIRTADCKKYRQNGEIATPMGFIVFKESTSSFLSSLDLMSSTQLNR